MITFYTLKNREVMISHYIIASLLTSEITKQKNQNEYKLN